MRSRIDYEFDSRETPWITLFDEYFTAYYGWTSSAATAEEIIKEYNSHMNSIFPSYMSKSRGFGKTDYYTTSHYILFEDKRNPIQKLPLLEYDGIPFICLNIRKFYCQRGVDKHKTRSFTADLDNQVGDHDYEVKRRKIIRRSSKKVECPAEITIREIVRFPEFAVNDNTKWKRHQASKRLREHLKEKKDVKSERRFYVILPQESGHQNHILKPEKESNELVSSDKPEKESNELVSSDITCIIEA